MVRKLGFFVTACALVAGAASAADQQAPARAKANLASLIVDSDYPAEALAAREAGTVQFRLDISASGRVTACTLLRSSGSAALDSATCRLMQSRGRFTPARDSAGNPIPDEMAGRIEWRLPPDPVPAG